MIPFSQRCLRSLLNQKGGRSVVRQKPNGPACLFRVAIGLHLHNLPILDRIDIGNPAFHRLTSSLRPGLEMHKNEDGYAYSVAMSVFFSKNTWNRWFQATCDKTLREHCPARRNQSTLLPGTRTMSGACNEDRSAKFSPSPVVVS